MALVRELEDHGCDLKASILCKYTKQEVRAATPVSTNP